MDIEKLVEDYATTIGLYKVGNGALEHFRKGLELGLSLVKKEETETKKPVKARTSTKQVKKENEK
jgi:hypothetical protein